MVHIEPSCTTACQVPPFIAESTPQPGSLEEASTAGELFQQQVQDYLIRFLAAICADLQCMESKNYNSEFEVFSVEINLPNIVSKGAVSIDTIVPDTPLGAHVVSWAPQTDATTIDDLLLQFLVVAEDTVRLTAQNPTAGAVNPAPITFQFVLALIEDT